MPKAKDTRPVDITWDTRNNAASVLIPIINEVLGAEFSEELYPYESQGILLFIGTKYKPDAPSWAKAERHWLGTTIKLYFKDVDYRTVHRTILVKPGESLDADKLRSKWAEILALKAADDRRQSAQQAQQQSAANKETAVRAEMEQLGLKSGLSDVKRCYLAVSSRGIELKAPDLTPAQAKQVLDLIATF